ncbi:MAG TPA: LLM class flavin-dependent oxidoreductase [Hyphomicrobiaceae bacterium]|jgi:alkanesulfonate monooxygenase SsuD/methylene tetrahydromethanopterin reductase-like flavin-dependent oxidoreductase (luciferase family)|nr:LLM class flavin-dependent oxidoreductase [Hyphomicrobiaceae bacterium]
MKFGLFGGAKSSGDGPVGDSIGYRKYIDYVLRAEELGFHSVFVVEHHFTGVGQLSASLNFLSYLAGRTERLRLGTAVVVLPWHNPVLLAEQVATLDLLCNGRLDFGVGKGYRDAEFAGFSIPMEEASARFDETMAFLRKAWSAKDRFSHYGHYWRFENVVIEPRPVQHPHPPLWMGAGSLASIQRAAREGFNLLLDQIAPVDLIIERVAAYRHALHLEGRPYHPGQIAVARALQIVRSEQERQQAYNLRIKVLKAIGGLARGRGAERYQNIGSHAEADLASEEAALLGTPEEIIARLKKLAAGGVDYVLLVDPTGSLAALDTFAKEIMPQFACMPAPPAAVEEKRR